MNDGSVREALVITDGSEAAKAALGAHTKVLFRVSGRVMVVRDSPEAIRSLEKLRGVLHVFDKHVIADISVDLDEDERTFLQGCQRRKQPDAPREQDGQDWDVAGLEPPD